MQEIAHLTLKPDKPSAIIRGYRAAAPIRRWVDQRLTNLTDDWIAFAYERHFDGNSKVWVSLASKARTTHKNYLIRIESEVIMASGLEKISGDQLTLTFLGDSRSLKYIIHSLYKKESIRINSVGRCLSKYMYTVGMDFANKCDMLIFDHATDSQWIPPEGDWVNSPRWVRMVLDIPAGITVEEFREKFLYRQKKNIKKVLREGLYLEESNDPEDLEFFIEKIHKPTIKNRYGNFAGIPDRSYYVRLARKGRLFFYCLPTGARVGGLLALVRNNIMYCVMNGFLDGDPQWLERGVLAADYLYSIEYAIKNGIRRIDTGEAMPVIDNGLYRHKLRWGFKPILSPWHDSNWLFWIPAYSRPALAWMRSHLFSPHFSKYGGENISQFMKEAIAS